MPIEFNQDFSKYIVYAEKISDLKLSSLFGWVRGGGGPQKKSQRNSRFSALSKYRGTRAPQPSQGPPGYEVASTPARLSLLYLISIYDCITAQKVPEHRKCLSTESA